MEWQEIIIFLLQVSGDRREMSTGLTEYIG